VAAAGTAALVVGLAGAAGAVACSDWPQALSIKVAPIARQSGLRYGLFIDIPCYEARTGSSRDTALMLLSNGK
jgi:hypothetical protein